jgi:hypothetical protein
MAFFDPLANLSVARIDAEFTNLKQIQEKGKARTAACDPAPKHSSPKYSESEHCQYIHIWSDS